MGIRPKSTGLAGEAKWQIFDFLTALYRSKRSLSQRESRRSPLPTRDEGSLLHPETLAPPEAPVAKAGVVDRLRI
jgi:hypothetical protein